MTPSSGAGDPKSAPVASTAILFAPPRGTSSKPAVCAGFLPCYWCMYHGPTASWRYPSSQCSHPLMRRSGLRAGWRSRPTVGSPVHSVNNDTLTLALHIIKGDPPTAVTFHSRGDTMEDRVVRHIQPLAWLNNGVLARHVAVYQ